MYNKQFEGSIFKSWKSEGLRVWIQLTCLFSWGSLSLECLQDLLSNGGKENVYISLEWK